MAVGGSQNDCTRNDPPPRGGVGDGLRRVTIMGRLDGAGASSRAELARVGAALGLLLKKNKNKNSVHTRHELRIENDLPP